MKRIVLGLVLALLPSSAWALEITDFGGAPDSGDTTPALARALTVALSGPDRTIHFGGGDYAFLTTPPVLSGGVQLQGEGPYNTTLTRHYSNGEFLVGHGNGLAFRRFAIGSIVGTHGGTALHLIASDAIGRGGKHVIEDVRILAGVAEGPMGTFALPFFLDGTNKLRPPIGIRAVTVRNLLVFDATQIAVQWWNCISCEWFGGGVYQGRGTTDAIVVGGPLAEKNWIEADIDWLASYVARGAMRAR
ncbi:MAG: hypothetical protein E6K82_12395 [Candidatus Rokuibacteriota bacterium]|nr:MAG: hypothetical protein E6K82_12395 [Candidatus Rokubacteria bacterium]